MIFQDIQVLVQPRVSYQSSPPPPPPPPPPINSNLLGMNSFLSWDLAQLQLHLGMWSSLILYCKTFSVHRGQKKQRKVKLPKKESLLADLSFFQQEVVDYQLHCDLHLVLKSFRKLGTSHMVTHFSKQTNNSNQMLATFCSQRVSHFRFWWCYTRRIRWDNCNIVASQVCIVSLVYGLMKALTFVFDLVNFLPPPAVCSKPKQPAGREIAAAFIFFAHLGVLSITWMGGQHSKREVQCKFKKFPSPTLMSKVGRRGVIFFLHLSRIHDN